MTQTSEQSSQHDHPLEIDEHDEGELHLTAQRLINQYGSMLPQIHLTLASILQGVAVVFLVSAVNIPKSLTLSGIVSALATTTLYLPFLGSLMFIITAWNQFAFASLYLYWPINSTTSSLQFMLCFAEILTFANISHPSIWLLGMGATFGIGAMIRRNNRRLASRSLNRRSDTLMRRNFGKYAAFSLILPSISLCVLGLVRITVPKAVSASIVVDTVHFSPFDICVFGAFVVFMFFIMKNDDSVFTAVNTELLSGSRYTITKHGRLDVKDQSAEESVSPS